MNLKLEHLRVFVAVAESGTITDASEFIVNALCEHISDQGMRAIVGKSNVGFPAGSELRVTPPVPQ